LQLHPKQRRKQIRNDGRNQAVALVLWINGTDSLLIDDLLNDSVLGKKLQLSIALHAAGDGV